MTDYERARQRMVETQIAARGVRDRRVLAAMREVPREMFVDPGLEEFAYEDSPLPIAAEQTISQPYIVALMLEAAELKAGDRVLEVGAGSGYAAAVLSRLAGKVHAIERHAVLAQSAQWRFDQLGYDNIELIVGDGSAGLPASAPYDAILVAAGAPVVPDALREQLAVGGRLIVPVGDEHQHLRKVRRVGEKQYEEEDLGAVRFVPLIGEQGWSEDGTRSASRHAPGQSQGLGPSQLIAQAAEPLPDVDAEEFAAVFDRYAGCRVVLLGECSHGTSEFYRARAAITRRFVEKHGFACAAVEADWPDAAAVNRYVRHMPPRVKAQPPFQRFPTWMWRNTEAAALVEWMREFNAGRGAETQVGFYGLDLYSLGASIAAVLEYLDRVDPEAARVARQRYGCLTPWQNSPATYGRAVLNAGYRSCEDAVVKQCRELLGRRFDYAGAGDERWLDATQNARLVTAAERYYRIMYYGGAESWNLRDTHMFETLEHLLEANGPDARILVWAHNSHIGDARATDMGQQRGELNIGQLCREKFGSDAALVGFGTHAGTVAAAEDWDEDLQIMTVRPSRADSVERLCHDTGIPRFLLDLREGHNEVVRRRLMAARLERFIGVIYRPETELYSHYASVSLPRQFDGYVWFDQTNAVTPLGPQHAKPGAPETYPFGV
jgi:protein-L-isoaspartate(D-aspartate) O-methyltransferase